MMTGPEALGAVVVLVDLAVAPGEADLVRAVVALEASAAAVVASMVEALVEVGKLLAT